MDFRQRVNQTMNVFLGAKRSGADSDRPIWKCAERAVDISAGLAVTFAFRFQVLAQFRRIHRIRASVHVDEIRLRACLGDAA